MDSCFFGVLREKKGIVFTCDVVIMGIVYRSCAISSLVFNYFFSLLELLFFRVSSGFLELL